MTDPIEGILNRNNSHENLTDLLNEFAIGIEEIVNFGTHILQWEVSESSGSDENLPVSILLRHILDLADSVSILVRNGSIDPCKPLLRPILEAALGLEYILEKDFENRSLAFLMWHFQKDLKLLMKLRPGTESNKQLFQKLNSDKSVPQGIQPTHFDELEKQIQDVESNINSPLYSNVKTEYDQLIDSGRKNPAWYELFSGPKNLEELTNRLHREGFYEIFYRTWSGPTHGTHIIRNSVKSTNNGGTILVSLRHPEDSQQVTQHTFTLLITCFQNFVLKRLPQHTTEFYTWYDTIIKPAYHQLLTKQLITMKDQ